MVKLTKCSYYEENRPLLVLSVDSEKLRISDPVCEAAVARGAVNYLGRWPTHVLAAFVAGCLIFGTFVFLGIISAILTIPNGEIFRTPRNIDSNDEPNLYFIKHENRTWSSKELCYIESTARTYKNLSIYLINLLADNNRTERNPDELLPRLFLDDEKGAKEDDFNEEYKSMINKIEIISEDKSRREDLSAFNVNVKNVDVSIRRFFNGSRLAGVYDRLNQGMIEMAARAYVLWNFPGIAVDPGIYPKLEFLEQYLCSTKNPENRCRKSDSTTMEINGDIQASSVPCQAFLDYLISRIATNEFSDQESTLTKAINDFCRRSSQCRGVRLLKGVQKTDVLEEDKFNCPTIIFPNNQTIRDYSKNYTNFVNSY